MTFDEYANNPESSKIVLCEFDIEAGDINFDITLNIEAGIYGIAITPGIVTIINANTTPPAGNGFYTNQNIETYYDITGLIINGTIEYTKVYSIAELRMQNEGYFFDKAGTLIGCPCVAIHFNNFGRQLDKTIQLKQVFGFCTKGDSDKSKGVYFNNTFYEPRIKSVPMISKSRDPLYWGVIRYQGGNIEFENDSGYFDNFKDYNLFRTPATIKIGFSGLDYDLFKKVFTGYIENYSYGFDSFSVKLQDKRKGLTNKVPENVFTKAAYTDIDDDNVNKVKQISFGNCRNVPVLCVNSTNESATHYLYLLGDVSITAITSVSAVYCNDVLLSSGVYTINLSTGVLSINAAAVADNITEVSVDMVHINISNALLVAKYLLDYYADVEFNVNNYYTAEWNIAQAQGRDVSLVINESTEIIKIIEQLCDASDWIFLVKDDGRYSARIYDADRQVAKTIENDEWLETPEISLDESQFLSSALVKYNKNWKSGGFRSYLNTTYKADTILKYKGEQEKDFETILYTEAGAIAKSESIMLVSKNIKEIVTRKTKIQNYDLEIMDFIKGLPAKRYSGAETINQIWEVLGRNIDLNTFEVESSLRFVKTFVPIAPVEYASGILWNEYLFGDRIHEVAYE